MSEPPVVRPSVPEPPIVAPNGPSTPHPKAGGDRKVDAGGASAGTGAGHWSDLLHKRWAVLAMLFGATAALGIPFLWKSRGFWGPERWFGVTSFGFTPVLFFWLFAKFFCWAKPKFPTPQANPPVP